MFELDKKKFGAFVAQLRKEKGYTQKELGEKLFLSDKAISKWETGVSIPDTALLLPLAELLGVSVTELLLYRRMDQNGPMDADQVEAVVKTALTYSKEEAGRAYQEKSKWPFVYLCSAALGSIGIWINSQHQVLSENLLTCVVLAAVFGAYFCFLVKTKLPMFYDRNRCGMYYDGVFRMNVPGVSFNNANWPQIVRVVRIWSCLVLALYPILNLGMCVFYADLWRQIERYVLLVLTLGGLFLPIWIAGRKDGSQ